MGAFGFFFQPAQNQWKGLKMEGQFFRSYVTFEMFPLTIHCRGFRYKEATVLTAGFKSFGCDKHRVSAFITLKDGTPDLAKELLEILDQQGNFTRCRFDNSSHGFFATT